MYFKKKIYLKIIILYLRIPKIIRRQLLRKIGCYFVINIFFISNLNYKISNHLDEKDQNYLKSVFIN